MGKYQYCQAKKKKNPKQKKALKHLNISNIHGLFENVTLTPEKQDISESYKYPRAQKMKYYKGNACSFSGSGEMWIPLNMCKVGVGL